MHATWQAVTRSINKLKFTIFTTTLIATAFVPMLAAPNAALAVTDCSPNSIVSGGGASNWLTSLGGGVNVCSTGDDSNNYVNNINGASTLSGWKWECVELVNRLYLTKGWITATWTGNGNTLDNNVPAGLTKENNGSISSLSPGDVITLDNGGNGHAAIINTIVNGTINIINQNATLNSSAYIDSGTLGSGTAHLHMNGWSGFSVQAVIHHPSSSWWASTSGTDATKSTVAAIGHADGSEDIFGISSAGALQHKDWTPGGGWTTWLSVSAPASPLESISVILNPDGHWDVYGLADNGHLYQDDYRSGTGWGGWTDHGAPSSPIIGFTAKIYPTDLSQFIYATSANGHLWQISWASGTGWGSWIDRGAPASTSLVARPTELITTDKHIYIFAIGSDGHIWQKGWYQGVWSDFLDRGVSSSSLTNAPVAVLSSSGDIGIYAISSSDGRLWERKWVKSTGVWSWANLGQTGVTFIDSPTVALSPDDHKDMYVTSSDGRLWQIDWRASTGWAGWIDRGNPSGVGLISSPSVVLSPNSNQDTYTMGNDTHVWQKAYNASGGTWSWFDQSTF